ncbi:MAG: flavin reductase family protein [Clostridiales bacterium]|nr:flavin reductase family protein [Clostridiales bacterium]
MVEFDSQNSIICPLGVFVIGTYDESGVPNAMTAAWGSQSDFGEISISLSKHKTTENFEKTGAFTVAFATADTVKESDYFGIESGKNINKIEKAGFHYRKSDKVNAPIILEYPLTLECKVRNWNTETGILTGEIVSSVASESIITDGKVDLGKLRPIMYDSSMHLYRVIGEAVGHAYSEGISIKNSGAAQKWDN